MRWLWVLVAVGLGERAMSVWDNPRLPLWARGPISVLLMAAGGLIFYTGFWRDGRTAEETARDHAAAAVQLESDRQRAAVRVQRAAVVAACREHAWQQSVHRSTVAFERELEPKVNPDGSAMVGLRFRVKNTFGLELTYGMICVVSPKGQADGVVFEVDK